MPTITVLRRNDRFPVGTSVAIHPAAAQKFDAAPTTTAIASATVAADGTLTVTSGSLVVNDPYVAYAVVAGEHRYLKVTAPS